MDPCGAIAAARGVPRRIRQLQPSVRRHGSFELVYKRILVDRFHKYVHVVVVVDEIGSRRIQLK